MNLNPRTRCPYTLKLLTELVAVSDEHVIPDALGCPASYSVRADTAINSELGRSADSNFVDSFFVRMLRSQHGVKSRSGPASMLMEGTTVDGGHPVRVTLPHERSAEVYFKKPFESAEDGMGGSLVAGADWEKKFAELKRNFARKGKKVEISSRETIASTTVHGQAEINLTHLKAGLMKIAYLAAFEYLGDPFLDDQINAEWQKAIRATELGQMEDVKIHGCCFDGADILKALLPAIEAHQHAIVVTRFPSIGAIVGVRLFGSPVLSICLRVSESQDFGLEELQGKLVVLDAKTKVIQSSSFKEFFLQKCGVHPPTTAPDNTEVT